MFSKAAQRYASRNSIRKNQKVCKKAWPAVLRCLDRLLETASEEGYPKTAELAAQIAAARGTPVRVFGETKVALR